MPDPIKSFVHQLHRPAEPDGTAIVLLHGTGGDESSLVPFGTRLAPRATVLGIRGRSADEGYPRFFRRLTAVTFDQDNIREEATALAAFMRAANEAFGLRRDRTLYLGYSNGANMIGAVMLLEPDVVRNAVLLRGMNVLESAPSADLSEAKVQMVTGARDPYGPYAEGLEQLLSGNGAHVDHAVVQAGHDIGMADLDIAQAFAARALA